MVKTKGSKDLQPRRTRSDKGKHHKQYRGRPIQKKRRVKFERRVGSKGVLKIWIWERKPMTKEGFLHWNIKIRHNVHQKITRMLNRHDVSVEDFNTKEKIEEFMAENYWTGEFLIMGFSHGKNKYHIKPVAMARVIVRERPEGNKARMIQNIRMHRYWFWQKG